MLEIVCEDSNKKNKTKKSKKTEANRLKDMRLRKLISEIKMSSIKPSVVIDFTLNSKTDDKNVNYEIAYKKYLEIGAEKTKVEYLAYQANQVKEGKSYVAPLHTWLGDYTGTMAVEKQDTFNNVSQDNYAVQGEF